MPSSIMPESILLRISKSKQYVGPDPKSYLTWKNLDLHMFCGAILLLLSCPGLNGFPMLNLKLMFQLWFGMSCKRTPVQETNGCKKAKKAQLNTHISVSGPGWILKCNIFNCRILASLLSLFCKEANFLQLSILHFKISHFLAKIRCIRDT